MSTRTKGGYHQATKWYIENDDDEDLDYHEDEVFDANPAAANCSRHSLETEDSSSDGEEAAAGRDDSDSRFLPRLFHSTPTLSKRKFTATTEKNHGNDHFRSRAPTNEKLEKYKFMLVNIEPDADILDPGVFALMEDSYMGFDFNDYPSEVICPFPNACDCEGMQELRSCLDYYRPESRSIFTYNLAVLSDFGKLKRKCLTNFFS